MAYDDTRSFSDDILTALKRRRLVIAAVATLAVGITAILTLVLPPTYEASASLFVRFGREYVYRPEVGQQAWSPFRAAELINSELEILNSRKLKERLVDEMEPGYLYPDLNPDSPVAGAPPAGSPAADPSLADRLREAKDWVKDSLRAALAEAGLHEAGREPDPAALRRDTAIRKVEKDLAIKSPKDSNVIYVSFRHQDPDKARQVVTRLIAAFLEERVAIYGEDRGTVLTEQSNRYEETLTQALEALQNFKRAHGITDLRAQTDSRIQREAAIVANVQAVQQDIDVLKERLVALQRRDQTLAGGLSVSSLVNQGSVDRAMDRWLDLMLREQEALATAGPRSAAVMTLRQAQDGLRTYLDDQRRVEIARVNSEMSLKSVMLAGLQANLKALREELSASTIREVELTALQRNVEQAAENYRTFRQKADEANVGAILDQQRQMSVRTLQPPTVPSQPVGLGKATRVAIGGVLGFLLALLLAVSLERRRLRVRLPAPVPAPVSAPVPAPAARGVPMHAGLTAGRSR